MVEICGHHLHSVPELPSRRTSRAIPSALEALVLRCLEKAADRRFENALDLRKALEELATSIPWSDEDADAWWRAEGDSLVLERAQVTSRVSDPLTVGSG